VLFKSTGLLRPLLVTLVFGILARAIRNANVVIVPLFVAAILPIAAYRDALSMLNDGEHPLRTASDCVRMIADQPGNAQVRERGLYMTGPDESFGHEYYYYFHRMRPIRRAQVPSLDILQADLYNPDEQRPVLIADKTYHAFLRESSLHPSLIPLVDFQDGNLLLLPGPYAACNVNTASDVAPR
jgi:hypothetical protein